MIVPMSLLMCRRLISLKEVIGMWNIPTKARLDKIPRLYETERVPLKDKVVHLHFFIGGCDWYIAEFDGEDTFWGFAHLGDDQCAEWGYISLNELKSIKVDGWLEIDCELEDLWTPKRAVEIEKIRTAHGWFPENDNQRQHCRSLMEGGTDWMKG